jgi:biotin carboxyl carrier protein
MQRVFKISVNGTSYDVAVEELTEGGSQLMPNYTPSAGMAPVSYAAPVATAAPVASPSATPAAAGTGDQCAQMGGVVANILVKEGQSVNEGDRIMDLEAMKMKVPVMANRSGSVTRILVAIGDGVESGQVLLTIA